MKTKTSNRKTTNKNHESPNSVVIETAENIDEILEFESNYRKSNNINYWFKEVESYLRDFLVSKSLPSDPYIKHKSDECGLISLKEVIKIEHLDIPGAFEAASVLEYLISSHEKQNHIEENIRNNIRDESLVEAMISELRGMILDNLKANSLIKKVEEERLNDYVQAGRSRTTPAHEARTEVKLEEQSIAWAWIEELRREGKNKTECYIICEKRLNKYYRDSGKDKTIKWGTIKKWFVNRKDFPPQGKK